MEIIEVFHENDVVIYGNTTFDVVFTLNAGSLWILPRFR